MNEDRYFIIFFFATEADDNTRGMHCWKLVIKVKTNIKSFRHSYFPLNRLKLTTPTMQQVSLAQTNILIVDDVFFFLPFSAQPHAIIKKQPNGSCFHLWKSPNWRMRRSAGPCSGCPGCDEILYSDWLATILFMFIHKFVVSCAHFLNQIIIYT